ncbi:site-2 protease family protein [Thermoplasmatales archaeon AK]|nr:site-2 protease family protein [Thermoplasmatales archaeon AK]
MENQGEPVRVQSEDLGYVVDLVKRWILPYEVQVTPISIRFYYVNSDNPNLSEAFDEIRTELVQKGYIPFLYQNGEHYLEVTRRPETRYRGITVNIIMLILTLLSTVYVGSTYVVNFMSNPSNLLMRLFYALIYFSLPLMVILGVHETGHYIVARHHKVKASLPFFIPFPLTLGTFGAFISLRDPVPNRRAMTEIGVAGPIFGFLTALPLLFVATYLQNSLPVYYHTANQFGINLPLIYPLLHILVPKGKPLFPMTLAVWVGMFATAMNLIPVGQLDGGHVVRGLLGRRANIVDYIFVAFLFGLGFIYSGWWLLAIFVVILGLTHPPALDDYSPVRPLDVALGVAALAMFILTFTPVPVFLK